MDQNESIVYGKICSGNKSLEYLPKNTILLDRVAVILMGSFHWPYKSRVGCKSRGSGDAIQKKSI